MLREPCHLLITSDLWPTFISGKIYSQKKKSSGSATLSSSRSESAVVVWGSSHKLSLCSLLSQQHQPVPCWSEKNLSYQISNTDLNIWARVFWSGRKEWPTDGTVLWITVKQLPPSITDQPHFGHFIKLRLESHLSGGPFLFVVCHCAPVFVFLLTVNGKYLCRLRSSNSLCFLSLILKVTSTSPREV